MAWDVLDELLAKPPFGSVQRVKFWTTQSRREEEAMMRGLLPLWYRRS
jgi:hypothetical protein